MLRVEGLYYQVHLSPCTDLPANCECIVPQRCLSHLYCIPKNREDLFVHRLKIIWAIPRAWLLGKRWYSVLQNPDSPVMEPASSVLTFSAHSPGCSFFRSSHPNDPTFVAACIAEKTSGPQALQGSCRSPRVGTENNEPGRNATDPEVGRLALQCQGQDHLKLRELLP